MTGIEDAIASADAQVKAEEQERISTPYNAVPTPASYIPAYTDGDSWLTKALNQIKDSVMPTLDNEDHCQLIAAMGLAAASVYLLYYTDSVEVLAGQVGGVAQGAGTALAGIAQGLGNAVPDVAPVPV